MLTVLVIDDDPVVQRMLQKALRYQGYQVLTASDGEEGMAQIQQCRPALIICDWMMPRMDGLEVCRRVKGDPDLTTTFFILLTSRGGLEDRVEGLDNGADDFLSKPIEITELQARVRAGLRIYQLNQDLRRQKQQLERELSEAADYVRSLLPPPMEGVIHIDSRFVPSSQLGGDCFDYFWLDPDYLVVYLLDVSGHGLGAALPSIAVLNLLRSQSLPNVNFYQPHDVLRALNDTFQMDDQNAKYFTIWYGVYNRVKRQLTYGSAGHPPAILLTNGMEGQVETHPLRTPGLPVGMIEEVTFVSKRCEIPQGSCLYVFSDGIYELVDPQIQTCWGLDAFIHLLTDCYPISNLDLILQMVQKKSCVQTFDDDLSLLRIQFG